MSTFDRLRWEYPKYLSSILQQYQTMRRVRVYASRDNHRDPQERRNYLEMLQFQWTRISYFLESAWIQIVCRKNLFRWNWEGYTRSPQSTYWLGVESGTDCGETKKSWGVQVSFNQGLRDLRTCFLRLSAVRVRYWRILLQLIFKTN